MCLAIPGEVLSLEGDVAQVSVNGVICEAGLALSEGIAVGDFVIVHAGFILAKLSREDAEDELSAIRAAIVVPGHAEPGPESI
jgi:hydrogenase expression/formation protein HypC